MASAPRTPVKQGSDGMTLIELMFVLLLVAIGILALSGVQTRSQTDVYTTGRRSRALAVAQTQMEVTRGLGWTLAVPDTGVSDIFNYRTDVDSVDDGLKRVTVTVFWSEKGTSDSLQLVNLVSAR